MNKLTPDHTRLSSTNYEDKETTSGENNEDLSDEGGTAGSTLSNWIYLEAQRRGMSISEVAGVIGMSRAYLFRLKNYPASALKLGRQYLESIADFLDVPLVAVMLAAGQLRADDLVPRTRSMHEEVERAFRYIQEDPMWAVLLEDANEMSHAVKMLVVRTYEKQEGKKLLSDNPYTKQLAKILMDLE